MSTPAPLSGRLRARLDIPSWRLSQNLPIEIRDSRLRLLGEFKNDQIVELKPGWYEVSAVLNDGLRHSETVRVIAGELQGFEVPFNADGTRTSRTWQFIESPGSVTIEVWAAQAGADST